MKNKIFPPHLSLRAGRVGDLGGQENAQRVGLTGQGVGLVWLAGQAHPTRPTPALPPALTVQLEQLVGLGTVNV